MSKVYVAVKGCGCIVGVTSALMERKPLGKLLALWVEAGYDIEMMSLEEVVARGVGCKCGQTLPLPLFGPAEEQDDEGNGEENEAEDAPQDTAAEDESLAAWAERHMAEGEKAFADLFGDEP